MSISAIQFKLMSKAAENSQCDALFVSFLCWKNARMQHKRKTEKTYWFALRRFGALFQRMRYHIVDSPVGKVTRVRVIEIISYAPEQSPPNLVKLERVLTPVTRPQPMSERNLLILDLFWRVTQAQALTGNVSKTFESFN